MNDAKPPCPCLMQNLAIILLGPQDEGRWWACPQHDNVLMFDGLKWHFSDNPEDVEKCYALG